MGDWQPEQFTKDPTANALLNIAAELNFVGRGVDNLLYAIKYGKDDGMSLAEAVEVSAGKIASAIDRRG